MDPIRNPDPRRAVARLAVAVMAADGRITPAEVAALGRLDELGLGHLGRLVEEELDLATREPIDLRTACAALAGASTEAAATLLAALADIAASDAVVTDGERATYEAVARLVGVPERESAHILEAALVNGTTPGSRGPARASAIEAEGGRPPAAARRPAGGMDRDAAARARATEASGGEQLLERARRVLGIDEAAGPEERDAAYLAVVGRFNPAGVVSLGPDFVALAARKLADATAAWEILVAADAAGD